ncbi:MAG: hypothetical protein OHK0021_13580 [Bryobacter sp.]
MQMVPDSSPDNAKLAQFFLEKPKHVDKDNELACTVLTYRPRLSFGFQYWTGFDILLRARDFARYNRQLPLNMVVEIENAEKKKRYYYDRATLPQGVPDGEWWKRNVELSLGGSFLVGVGKYKAKLLLVDAIGRTCWKEWKMDAPRTSAPVPTPPGEVRNNVVLWEGMEAKTANVAARVGSGDTLTVYLHAAPLFSRRNLSKLRSWDKSVLLGSLTSLLKASRFGKARVIAFNLDARKVVFRSENFGKGDLIKLIGALDNLEMGTVSVDTLAQSSEAKFLAELLELGATKQAEARDAVVFLGPTWRWGRKPDERLVELRKSLPPTVYLAYRSAFGQTTDSLAELVKAGKGKILDVYGPLDLAKAIREIDVWSLRGD